MIGRRISRRARHTLEQVTSVRHVHLRRIRSSVERGSLVLLAQKRGAITLVAGVISTLVALSGPFAWFGAFLTAVGLALLVVDARAILAHGSHLAIHDINASRLLEVAEATRARSGGRIVDSVVLLDGLPWQALLAKPAAERDGGFELPPELRGARVGIIRSPRWNSARSLLVNDRILGLQWDPNDDATPPVFVRGAYFDKLCSDEIGSCQVVDATGKSGLRINLFEDHMVGADGALRPLPETGLLNTVGISTIAVSRDGWAVLNRQSAKNIASGGKLAPTGSGGLSPVDLPASSAEGETFGDVIRRGMERELCEETPIRPEDIRTTVVLGYGRWIARGGKPEFFGVTVLNRTHNEVRWGDLKSVEQRYGDGAVKFDLGAGPVEDAEAAASMLGSLQVGADESLSAPAQAIIELGRPQERRG